MKLALLSHYMITIYELFGSVLLLNLTPKLNLNYLTFSLDILKGASFISFGLQRLQSATELKYL